MTSSSKHPLIGHRFPVLDHGFVELLDFMGSDQDIAEAAWVSTEFGNLNKSPVPQFLDYLMRKFHWSPFEMCEVKLRVYLPLVVEAQWVTHRTANKNQASARYVELPDNNYVPDVWRQGTTGHNKQGSDEISVDQKFKATDLYLDLVYHARETEKALRELGVAPEMARFSQLGTQYTMKVWKMDLRNLMNFLKQRTDGHAQWEIRQYADIIEHILSELFPEAMKAWRNHIKNAVTFSEDELGVLGYILDQFCNTRTYDDALDTFPHDLRASRQRELIEKLRRVQRYA